MRSLQDAGLTALPRFVKADQIGERPFEVVFCRLNPNGYGGQPELVYQFRIIPQPFPGGRPGEDDGGILGWDNGQAIGPYVSWSCSPTPSREQHARYFATPGVETLGPCQFQWIESRTVGGSPFANIVDYVDLSAPSQPVAPPPPPARQLPRPSQPVADYRQRAQQRVTRTVAAPPPPPLFDDDDGLPS